MKTEVKYAPTNLNDVIYPNVATERRIKAYAAGQLHGNILFHGPNGTAKSTVALLLAKAIGGAPAVIEVMTYDELAANKDMARYLKNSCSHAEFYAGSKYFLILSEFDTAKSDLHTLWTTMDSSGDSMMVIITTNEPMDVHRSIRSRCEEIEMPALTSDTVLRRAQYILAAEGLLLPDEQVLHYLRTKDHTGDLRKYWSVLDDLLFLHSTNAPMPTWT